MAVDLTAHFGADFSAFETAVKQADASLKNFEADANKVEKSLNRMVDQFSGRKLAQEAQLMTEAIGRLGGATALTQKEQQRVNTTLTEAIAKFRAVGKEAPQAMLDLAAATKSAAEPTSLLSGYVSQLVGYFTVGTVIAFGRSVL